MWKYSVCYTIKKEGKWADFPKYGLKDVGDDCNLWYPAACPDHSVPQAQEEEDGVSRVQVTSRRSSHKVERVSGLVTLSHVEVPKVSKAKPKGDSEWFPEHNFSSVALNRLQKRQLLLREADTNEPDDVMITHSPWQFSEASQKCPSNMKHLLRFIKVDDLCNIGLMLRRDR